MTSPLAKDIDEQVRTSVDDLRRIGELGGRVDEADDLDDARHAIERSELVGDRGQEREAGTSSGLIPFLDGEVASDLACDRSGPLAREDQQTSRSHGMDVVASGQRKLRQLETELTQPGGGRRHDVRFFRGERKY